MYIQERGPGKPDQKKEEVFMLFGLGIPELAVIAAIVFLLFGPSILRGGSKKIGTALREGRKAIGDIKSAIEE